MIIDANIYWMPDLIFSDPALLEQFLSCVPVEHGARAHVNEISGTNKKQIVIEKPVGYQNLNYVERQYSLEAQLRDLDEAGVDLAILKLPGCQEWLSLELCRKFNDWMAAHVQASNGRLKGLAVVPPWGTKDCLIELERCVHELGMSGVQLSAHYGDLYLDDEVFRPLLRQLNDLDIPAYIHHAPLPVQYDTLLDYNNLRRSYGRCADQVIAVAREIFSGIFAEFPNLKFVHSMLGGAFFSYVDQMFPQKSRTKEELDRFNLDKDYREYLRNNVFFEISNITWGKAQLECAVKVLGADKIIFGSSYPVRREWLLYGPQFVRELDISAEEQSLLLGENARRIYNI